MICFRCGKQFQDYLSDEGICPECIEKSCLTTKDVGTIVPVEYAGED